MFKYHSIMWF